MAIKHSFTSTVTDNPAAAAKGEVLPSHWNADHVDSNGNPVSVRPQLSADTIYYISTTGSNVSGNGTAGNPWATAQHALDQTQGVDANGFKVTYKFSAGTYGGPNVIAVPVNARCIEWQGDLTDQTKVIFDDSDAAGNQFGCSFEFNTAQYASTALQITSVTIAPRGTAPFAGGDGIEIDIGPATLFLVNVKFVGATNNTGWGLILFEEFCTVFLGIDQANAYGGGIGATQGTTVIAGNWSYWLFQDNFYTAVQCFGVFNFASPVFSSACVFVGESYSLFEFRHVSGAPAGSFTGARYEIRPLSRISTNTNNTNLLPGTLPGIIHSGGSYDDLGFGQETSSGPPTTSTLAPGCYTVVKDTTQATGFGNALYVNDGGTILNLTPKFFLNGNTTFYVSNSGSDSNSGLSSGQAWKTLQHAVDTLATNVDANGFTITVQIADGTYAGFTMNGAPQGIGIYYQFLGNVTTPANVIINVNSGGTDCVDINTQVVGAIQFGGMAFTPGATHNGIKLAGPGLELYLAKCIFDGSAGCGTAVTLSNSFDDCQLGVDLSGSLGGGALGCTWKGTWAVGVSVDALGHVFLAGTQTLTSTPAWSTAFLRAQASGGVIAPGPTGVTFSGSATGSRFSISNNGAVEADGSGNLNFYPGNAAGTASNGAYDGLIYSQGSTPPNGQVPSYTSTLPTTVTSAGGQFQYTFDGSGNLYFCYQANTWAKYTNAAPFDNSGAGASEPIPVIFG